MLKKVNRVLLGLLGLLMAAAGAAVLAAGADLPGRADVAPPSWWPWREPSDVLLSRADRMQWRDEGWWWPVVIGALALALLLLLCWALAQTRRQRLSELPVGADAEDAGLLRARALEEVAAAEVGSYPGVARARMRLAGRRKAPRARFRIRLDPQADPGEAVRRLHHEALVHARTSAGLSALPTEARLRAVRHRPDRVS